MIRYKALFLSLIFVFLSIPISAQNFFSTEKAQKFFSIGARIGVNATNHTFNPNYFNRWNVNSWGSGFEAGVVATLSFRDYLAVQPGIFFESRTGNYAYATDYITNLQTSDTFTQMGHSRFYDVVIPIMAVIRFNVSSNVRWLVEAGPYGQINIQRPDADNIQVLERLPLVNDYTVFRASSHFYDYGIKIGSGLMFAEHFYFGIHYLAGLREVWGQPAGGKNKAWTFTLGYDF